MRWRSVLSVDLGRRLSHRDHRLDAELRCRARDVMNLTDVSHEIDHDLPDVASQLDMGAALENICASKLSYHLGYLT
jgi:hypothetical protein